MADETEVGHCKRDETDVYVGRGPGGRSMHDTPIGERGWLGNPYTVEDAPGREASIRKFRRDFEHRLRTDGEFRRAVGSLSGRTLGCWCQGLGEKTPACHAEVIAEWAGRISREVDDD